MPGITSSINNFNKNKFVIRFSNFPNFTKENIDVHVLNNYIKTFQVPDVSMPLLHTIYLSENQNHPSTIGNREFQSIQIEFFVDEEMKNFNALYAWMYNMRYGQTCGKKNLKGEELVRMDRIDTIELVCLNNDDEIVSKMKFQNCILTNIGALQLEYGQSEQASFTTTFDIENIDFELAPNDPIDREYGES